MKNVEDRVPQSQMKTFKGTFYEKVLVFFEKNA